MQTRILDIKSTISNNYRALSIRLHLRSRLHQSHRITRVNRLSFSGTYLAIPKATRLLNPNVHDSLASVFRILTFYSERFQHTRTRAHQCYVEAKHARSGQAYGARFFYSQVDARARLRRGPDTGKHRQLSSKSTQDRERSPVDLAILGKRTVT